jgi:hypothetical protein
VQAVEGGGDLLLAAGVGQQVAGQLPGQELIVGKVAIERGDDPVAIRRHVSLDIRLVAIGVRIPRQVQPVHRHALAVGRRRQVAIDQPLIGGFRRIGGERLDILETRRQSGQIESESPHQHLG